MRSKKSSPEEQAPATRNEMLSSIEAAKFLGISPGTLVQWRHAQREGQPPYHKLGKSVRYRLSSLEAWLESNAVDMK
ncbi:helix-turn-helix domain-containing protein [Schlesneria sp. T3-172]|uniref:helix-turn-helix domain-containing protein n=1 Tax=Schlesneria sphaerica TaxID=3373610 RepID=UPI0037C8E1E7